jgi:peptidyl-prolyl cis-trans isomerase C
MRINTMRAATPPTTIAVNGAVIAPADIGREVQNHAGFSPRQAWDEATRALVIRALLLQRASVLQLIAEPRSDAGLRETEEEALIRVLLETEVRTPTADEATCRRYYQSNLARFRSPDLYEPQHILFKADRDDQAAYAVATERATAVLQDVTAAPACFDSLARAVSDCPSAGEGGRLGQVAPNDTTPAFEAALVVLEAGQLCPEPVHTPYGVHVVRLDRKIAGHQLAFEQVRDRIGTYLEARSWRRAVAQYVSLLAGDAVITGFEMPGAASPLVQ